MDKTSKECTKRMVAGGLKKSYLRVILAHFCGAVAVSYYPQIDKNRCYDVVDMLTNRYEMKQVNIHAMICEETFEDTIQLIEDIKNDSRLKKLNAVVFLSLKQKGRGEGFW